MADNVQLPDWWAREKQQRQKRILIFLVLLLSLIGFYYAMSSQGVIGTVKGIPFDTARYVAFIHQTKEGRTELYAVRDDGTDLRQLTPSDDDSTKQDPSWTKDGKSVLYSSNRGGNRVSQVYILGQGDPRQLTHGTSNKYAPVASPDGKSCAFLTQGAVKIINLNGTNLYQIMPPPRAGNSGGDDESAQPQMELSGPFLSARFSSDGTSVAGVQTPRPEDMQAAPQEEGVYGDQIARVLLPNIERAVTLDFAIGREVSLDWEPKGTRLLVAAAESEVSVGKKTELISSLFFWDAAKSKEKPTPWLLARGYTIFPKNVSWSPDGKSIAFEIWRLKGEGQRELRGIVVLPADARPLLVQTEKDAEILCDQAFVKSGPQGKPQRPLWSPSGNKLLYEMIKPDGTRDVWVMNYDGTNPMNLTAKLGGDNAQAAWSPLTGEAK